MAGLRDGERLVGGALAGRGAGGPKCRPPCGVETDLGCNDVIFPAPCPAISALLLGFRAEQRHYKDCGAWAEIPAFHIGSYCTVLNNPLTFRHLSRKQSTHLETLNGTGGGSCTPASAWATFKGSS